MNEATQVFQAFHTIVESLPQNFTETNLLTFKYILEIILSHQWKNIPIL